MIVFINGPFGVGKTTTANLLVETLPNAMLCDPEVIGFVLRRLPIPLRKPDDYQDLALWRKLVPRVAKLLRKARRTDLIMPMTIWKREYFEAITTSLRGVDADLHIFRLTVSEGELRRRILSRPESEGGHEWCLSHMESGMKAARDPFFGTEINTDGRMSEEVAAEMLSSVGLEQIRTTASSAK